MVRAERRIPGFVPRHEEADETGSFRTRRRVQILEAACRVIARAGIAAASVDAVAAEVGVSRTLVHYYFNTREDLHRQTFEYVDERFDSYVLDRLKVGSAYERIVRLLLAEVDGAGVVADGWVVWSEISAAAFFDDQLRATVNKAADRWIDLVAKLVAEGRKDGSVRADVRPRDAAERLTGLVDSVGNRLMLGAFPTRRARALIKDGVRRELAS